MNERLATSAAIDLSVTLRSDVRLLMSDELDLWLNDTFDDASGFQQRCFSDDLDVLARALRCAELRDAAPSIEEPPPFQHTGLSLM